MILSLLSLHQQNNHTLKASSGRSVSAGIEFQFDKEVCKQIEDARVLGEHFAFIGASPLARSCRSEESLGAESTSTSALLRNEHFEQHARNELREKFLSIQSGLEHVREGVRE